MGRTWYWLIPFLIGLLLWLPTEAIPVSPDGAWYSGLAFNIYHGQGFVDLDGTSLYIRPLFPALIALAYHLWEPGPLSAFIIIRISFLANIVLVALFAKLLYGKWAGLVAGLLAVSAYTLNEWSTWVNLDPLLPTFLLIFITCCYLGFQREQIVLFIFAGVAIGLAGLVKETAIFFAPLPFLYTFIVPELRGQRFVKRAYLWGSMGFIATLLPWFIYVAIMAESPLALIGHAPTKVSDQLFDQIIRFTTSGTDINHSLIKFIKLPLTALRQFYTWHLAPNLMIAPVAVASLVAVGWSALYGNRASLYLIMAQLVYLPMIILQGTIGYRSRQSFILFFLLIIGAAYAVTIPIQRWDHATKRFPNYLPKAVTFFFCTILIFTQIEFNIPQHWATHLQQFNSFRALGQPVDQLPIRAPQPWWPSSAITIAADQFADWTEEEEWQPTTRVMSHGTSINRYANLATEGSYQFFLLEPITDFDRPTNTPSSVQERASDVVQLSLTRLNSVQQNNAPRREVVQSTDLLIHTQQSILNSVIENEIDYIITGHPEKWLATYFISHPAFMKVADFEYGTMQVFQVLNDKLSIIPLPPSIDRQVPQWLNELARLQPVRHQAIFADVFEQTFGWSAIEIENRIMAKPQTLYHANSFLYRHYASWIIDNWDYDTAVSIQQDKAALDPASPWPHITLGALYREQGERLQNRTLLEESATAYAYALNITPDNWWSAWAVTQMNKDDPTLIDDGLLTKALDTYEQIVASYPRNPQSYNRLAHIYRQLQRHDDAIALYEDALQLGIVNQDIYYGLGRTYEIVGKVEEAIHVYEIGLRKAPVETQGYAKIVKRLGEITKP